MMDSRFHLLLACGALCAVWGGLSLVLRWSEKRGRRLAILRRLDEVSGRK
jgi:hypothetical protein